MSAGTATCAQCGKRFTITNKREWAYRDGKVCFCGWKCIREHDAGIAPHKTAEPEKIPQVMPEETAERIRAAVDSEMRKAVKHQPVAEARKKREYRRNISAQKIYRVMTTMQRLKDSVNELSKELEALRR